MSHRISPRTFLPFHFLRSARSVLDNGNPIEYSVSKPASANLISPVSNSSHSKKYHKYITNIPQIYHKSTTKCDIVPQKCDIVPQNRVFYYKM